MKIKITHLYKERRFLRFSWFFIYIILAASCSESFEIRDPSKFNEEIKTKTDIRTIEDLVKLYYNYPPNEAAPFLVIKSRLLKRGQQEVTLIHDREEDDSERSFKIVMRAELIDNRWVVHEIKTNRRCYEGRGHSYWGVEWCS